MPDGKALQSCTSHDLGQNFSKAFEISFQDKNKEKQYAWQTSWGFSTRSIGGLIMMHGDDKGLKLPPKIAPVQVIVLPVKSEDEALVAKAKELCNALIESGIRAEVDARDGESLGFRINKWEVRGAPLRIEVGARDIESDSYVVARRDTSEKLKYAQKELSSFCKKLLEEIQENLFTEAKRKQSELMTEVHSFEEFKKIMETKRGFIKAFWCEDAECEAEIKEKTKATTRCLPVEDESGNKIDSVGSNVCVHCGKPATHKWLFAQAY
jgi:prolyl-tRNA synthetase